MRLVVTLAALGFSMAGPAAAATGMASSPARLDVEPCHETAGEAPVELTGGLAQHPDPAPSHLCCVVSQLVVPPIALPALLPPEPGGLLLRAGQEHSAHGREPAIPVPPPRPA